MMGVGWGALEAGRKDGVFAGSRGPWKPRGYARDPACSVPLTFTALPALVVGTSGNGRGKSKASCALSDANVRRKCHDLYVSSGGAMKPGRSDTQLASAQRVTAASNG